ncbi:MAG: hypothetical protein U0527_16190 [Candidatus Eisenbacteria bacterium]
MAIVNNGTYGGLCAGLDNTPLRDLILRQDLKANLLHLADTP